MFLSNNHFLWLTLYHHLLICYSVWVSFLVEWYDIDIPEGSVEMNLFVKLDQWFFLGTLSIFEFSLHGYEL